jgi:DMSO reductase anchor subunit
MVYASVRILQEWASPFTLVNYPLLGLASGLTLATALAAWGARPGGRVRAAGACRFTAGRRHQPRAVAAAQCAAQAAPTLQSAIGMRHPHITQRAMGFMGGAFNTREFFHGQRTGHAAPREGGFLVGASCCRCAAGAGCASRAAWLLAVAFVVQYAGLLAERWFFFAQANHPQNLYYQAVS